MKKIPFGPKKCQKIPSFSLWQSDYSQLKQYKATTGKLGNKSGN